MKLQFDITFSDGSTTQIEWSRLTTQIVSDMEYDSDQAIAMSEAGHPYMPSGAEPKMVAICDNSNSQYGDIGAASALGLLWCIARLVLACSGTDGLSCLTVTRAGMQVCCRTIPS